MFRFISGLLLLPLSRGQEMWMVPQRKHEYVEPTKQMSIMQTNTSNPSPDQFVSAHNAQRCKYGAQDVTWNADAAANAQAAADNCVAQGTMVHSASYQATPQAGENIYASASSSGPPPANAATAVNAWVSEVDNCPNDNSGCKNADPNCDPSQANAWCQVGHFTAAVWKGTTEIGCGVAKATTAVNGWYWTYVVCQYANGAANMDNYQGTAYPANVQIEAGDCSGSSGPSPTPSPPSGGSPTPAPDDGPGLDCVDEDPTYIHWSNGDMASCSELGGYCTYGSGFVAVKCPVTCGTCGMALQQQSSEIFTIPERPVRASRATKFSDQVSAHISAGGELDFATR